MELMFLLLTLIPEALGNLCTGRQSAVIHHPESCKKFIVCQDEEPTELTCPGDLYFDIIIRSCILHSLAHCGIPHARITTAVPFPYWTTSPNTRAIPTLTTSIETLPPIPKLSTSTDRWASLSPVPTTERLYTTEAEPVSGSYTYPTISQLSTVTLPVPTTSISSNQTDYVTNIPTMSSSFPYSSETTASILIDDLTSSLSPFITSSMPSSSKDTSSSDTIKSTANPIETTTDVPTLIYSTTSYEPTGTSPSSEIPYVDISTASVTYTSAPTVLSTESTDIDNKETTKVEPIDSSSIISSDNTPVPTGHTEVTYSSDYTSQRTLRPTDIESLPPIWSSPTPTDTWVSLPSVTTTTISKATEAEPSALPPIQTSEPYPHSSSSESSTSHSEYTIPEDISTLIISTTYNEPTESSPTSESPYVDTSTASVTYPTASTILSTEQTDVDNKETTKVEPTDFPSTISSKDTPVPTFHTETTYPREHTIRPTVTPTSFVTLEPITTNPISTKRWESLPTVPTEASSSVTEVEPSELPPISTQEPYTPSISSESTTSHSEYTIPEDISTLIISTTYNEPTDSSPTSESPYVDTSTASVTYPTAPTILSTEQTDVDNKETTKVEPTDFPSTISSKVTSVLTFHTETTYPSDHTIRPTVTPTSFVTLEPVTTNPISTKRWEPLPTVPTEASSSVTEVEPSELPPISTQETFTPSIPSESTTSQSEYTIPEDISTLIISSTSNEPTDSSPTSESPYVDTSTASVTYPTAPTIVSTKQTDVDNKENTKVEPTDFPSTISSKVTPVPTFHTETTNPSDHTIRPTVIPTSFVTLEPVTTNPISTKRWEPLPTVPTGASSSVTEVEPSELPAISTQEPYTSSIPSESTTSHSEYTIPEDISTLIISTTYNEPTDSSPTSESPYIDTSTASVTYPTVPTIVSTEQTDVDNKETTKVEPTDFPSSISSKDTPVPTFHIETTYPSDHTIRPTVTPTSFVTLEPVTTNLISTKRWEPLPTLSTEASSSVTEVEPSELPLISTQEPYTPSIISESTTSHSKYTIPEDISTLIISTTYNEPTDSSPTSETPYVDTSTASVTYPTAPTILNTEQTDVDNKGTTMVEPTDFPSTISSKDTPVPTFHTETTYPIDHTIRPTVTPTSFVTLEPVTTDLISTKRWEPLPTLSTEASSSVTEVEPSELPLISTQEPYTPSIISESTTSHSKYTIPEDISTLIISTTYNEPTDSSPTSETPYVDTSTASVTYPTAPTILNTEQTDVDNKGTTMVEPTDFPSTISSKDTPVPTFHTETTYPIDHTIRPTVTPTSFVTLEPVTTNPISTKRWESLPTVPTEASSSVTEVEPSELPPISTQEPYTPGISSESTTSHSEYTIPEDISTLIISTTSNEPTDSSPTSESPYVDTSTASVTYPTAPSIFSTEQNDVDNKETTKVEPTDFPSTISSKVTPVPTFHTETTYPSDHTIRPTVTPTSFVTLEPVTTNLISTKRWEPLPTLSTEASSSVTEVEPSELPPISTQEPYTPSIISESTISHSEYTIQEDISTLIISTTSNEPTDSSPTSESPYVDTSTASVTYPTAPTILNTEQTDVDNKGTTMVEPTDFPSTISSKDTPVPTFHTETTYPIDHTIRPTVTPTSFVTLEPVTTNPISTKRWESLPTVPTEASSSVTEVEPSELPPISTQEPYTPGISSESTTSHSEYTIPEDISTLIISTTSNEPTDSSPTSESPYVDTSTASVTYPTAPSIFSTEQNDVDNKETTKVEPTDFPSTISSKVTPVPTFHTETTYPSDHTIRPTVTPTSFVTLEPVTTNLISTKRWEPLPTLSTEASSSVTEVEPSELPPISTQEPYTPSIISESTISHSEYTIPEDISTLIISTTSNEPTDSSPTSESPYVDTSTASVTYPTAPTILSTEQTDVDNKETTKVEPTDFPSTISSKVTPVPTFHTETTYPSDHTIRPTVTPTSFVTLEPVTTNLISTKQWEPLPTLSTEASSSVTEVEPSELPLISTQEPYTPSIISESTISHSEYTIPEDISTLIISTTSNEPTDSSPTSERPYVDTSSASVTYPTAPTILSTEQTDVDNKETTKVEPTDFPSTISSKVTSVPTFHTETTYPSDHTIRPTVTPTSFVTLEPVTTNLISTKRWEPLPTLSTEASSSVTEVEPSELPPISTQEPYTPSIISESTTSHSENTIPEDISTLIISTTSNEPTDSSPTSESPHVDTSTASVTYPTAPSIFSTEQNDVDNKETTKVEPTDFPSTISSKVTSVPTFHTETTYPSDHTIRPTVTPTSFVTLEPVTTNPISTKRWESLPTVSTEASSRFTEVEPSELPPISTQKPYTMSIPTESTTSHSEYTEPGDISTLIYSTTYKEPTDSSQTSKSPYVDISTASVIYTTASTILNTEPTEDNKETTKEEPSDFSTTIISEITSGPPTHTDTTYSSDFTSQATLTPTRIESLPPILSTMTSTRTSDDDTTPLLSTPITVSSVTIDNIKLHTTPISDNIVSSETLSPIKITTTEYVTDGESSSATPTILSSKQTRVPYTENTTVYTIDSVSTVVPNTLITESNEILSPITSISPSSISIASISREVTPTTPSPIVFSSETAFTISTIPTELDGSPLPPIPEAESESPSPLPPIPVDKASTLPPQTEIPPSPVVCRPYRYYTVVNPENTKTFYYCVLGTRYLFKCPHSYEFDPATHVCENPNLGS